MRNREREGALAQSRESRGENCKYRKLHAVESRGEWPLDRQQQAVSWAQEVAANSAEH